MTTLKSRKIRRRNAHSTTPIQPPLELIIGLFSLTLLALAAAVFISPDRASGRVLGGPSQYDIGGPAGSGSFGSQVLLLSNGNIVVADPTFDIVSPPQIDVGAVHLYDGATGVRISSLIGTLEFDNVGTSVVPVGSGNFVVLSPNWRRGEAIGGAGAVTFCSGTAGCDGPVSDSNSLVGTKTGDSIGSNGIVVLSTGDYVVASPNWDNVNILNAGAVTKCSGVSGCVGEVLPANSLIGQTSSATGRTLVVLANGAYAAGSTSWRNGALNNAGAVTFCSGAAGCAGMELSTSNSLHGVKAEDQVGNIVTPLSNGNYVVSSSGWDSGAVTNVGAVTLCNGTTGCTPGPVSTANSMIGAASGDTLGSPVIPLANGNYVIGETSFDNGAATNAGSVTFCSGTIPCIGTVSSSNSLVGSTTNDQIGLDGIVPLANGNYVVNGARWDNPATTTANVGAVTFCSGLTGCSGPITAAGSLVGTVADDNIGLAPGDNRQPYGAITPLPNGSFTVTTHDFQASFGAVTFCNAATGCNGMTVSAANSLTGNTTQQFLGLNGVTALSNDSYVVQSSRWDTAAQNAGATKLCTDAVVGCTGTVTSATSFTGAGLSDEVGTFVTPLPNGNYVLASPMWNGPSGAADRGAVTLCTAAGCTSGVVTAANSMQGTTLDDRIGSRQNEVGTIFPTIIPHPDSSFSFRSPDWDNGGLADAGAVTFVPATGAAAALTPANSVFGNVQNGGDTMTSSFDPVHYQMVVGRPAENIVTIFRPNDPAPPPTPTPIPTPSVSPTPAPTPANCNWTTDTPISAPVVNSASASVGGILYSFGGISGGSTTANSYKFDGTSWTAIAPLPSAMKNGAAVSDGTNVFIMSGLTAANAPTGEVRRYNVADDTYTSLTGFTVANSTYNHSVVYLNGKIYKIGGNSGATGLSSTRTDIYDIATNSWSAGQALFATTSFMQVFTDGTYIYAAGGRFDSTNDANDTPRPNAYRFNPVTLTWNDSNMPDLPEPRWGATALNFDGGVLLIGGFVGTSATSPAATSVLNWDPVRNSWLTVYPSLPNARSLAAGGILSTSLNVVGGSATTEGDGSGTTTHQKLVCGVTASNVSVSGRVLTSEGRGVRSARVTITSQDGSTRSVFTGQYGRFQFNDVEPGETYVISVLSRRFSFSPQVVQVFDNIADINFVAVSDSNNDRRPEK